MLSLAATLPLFLCAPSAGPGGRLVGRVVDTDGRAVASVEIEPLDPSAAGRRLVEGAVEFDRRSGRFSIEPRCAGRVAFRLLADREGVGFGRTFVFETSPGATIDVGRIVVGTRPTLFGSVTDRDGRPVESEVLVTDAAARWIAYASTDASGRFVLDTDLESGEWIEIHPCDARRFADLGRVPLMRRGPVPRILRWVVERHPRPLVDVRLALLGPDGRPVTGPIVATLVHGGVAYARSGAAIETRCAREPFVLRRVPPGESERWVWAPERGWSAVERRTIEDAVGGLASLTLRLRPEPTRARAAVPSAPAARPGTIVARILPEGVEEVGTDARCGLEAPLEVPPSGALALRGLPAGRSLRIRLVDERERIHLERGLRLRASDAIDLGPLRRGG